MDLRVKDPYALKPERRETRQVEMHFHGRSFVFGSAAPVSIQSMNTTDPHDAKACLAQLERLAEAGCDIGRMTVPDAEAAKTLGEVLTLSPIPVVADIHFDARLACLAIEVGCPKIRINPGNIRLDRLKEIADLARSHQTVIRVGVNSGSIRPELRRKYGFAAPEALAETGLDAAKRLEDLGFNQIVLSLKSSDPYSTILAYRYAAKYCDYPFHVGVTESGTKEEGLVRSALGIGTLLAEGMGDTIRVSLTADPVEEVYAAKALLKGLHLRRGPELISCPTCGRTEVELEALASRVAQKIKHLDLPLRIAVMGCKVNGPGEAHDCDVGIAGGKDEYLLFVRGKVRGKVKEEEAETALLRLIEEEFGRGE